jgi:hypothetical protein
MPYTKKIVCLANSRKPPSGRCIAGREIVGGGFGDWIRPVSARPSREISEVERRYEDGTDPKVLDIIVIQMSERLPQHHQQENHVIDDTYYWLRRGAVSWRDLQAAVEDPAGPLWLNGFSSWHGRNDRVPDGQLSTLNRSLYLVRPYRLLLVVGLEGGQFGPARRRVRARFNVSGQTYAVGVTDPGVEAQYLARSDGEYPLDDALICVSLGEAFNGFAYKLAAAVITPEIE